jgi:hypothetical protein
MSDVTGQVRREPAGTAEHAPSAGEAALIHRVRERVRVEDEITLIVGSGVSAGAVPRIGGVLRIADQYARGRSDDGGLRRALQQAREALPGDAVAEVYAEYLRVFSEWVSGSEFDVIAQQAVLQAYRPPDRMASPLASHGLWQRIRLPLGERLENDLGSWQLPLGVHAAGHLLTRRPEEFGHRVLTTNFDPLLEIAVRSAGGQAITLPLDARPGRATTAGEDGAVRVYHLHGFWRPTAQPGADRLLHDPAASADQLAGLAEATAGLIRGDTVLVLGAGDRSGTLAAALAAVVRQRGRLRVLWAVHGGDAAAAALRRDVLRDATGATVESFAGVDADRFLPALAAASGVAVPPRAPKPRHRFRHHNWERQLVSQPDASPPGDVPTLLLQLERRFAWTTQRASPTTAPTRLLWPVRVGTRASVIHMVQAFAAGALARAGVEVHVCLDDYGARQAAALDSVRSDIGRWVAYTGPGAEPHFVRLSTLVEGAQRRALDTPEALLRPTDPWGIARAFYGEHNPSLYHVLAAVKAVPNMTTMDELQRNAWPIVQALLSRDANRLLTPLTLWAVLHDMLQHGPTDEIMTLGGRDDAFLWAQWQDTFRSALSQLHNPYIKGLSSEAQMLRWSSEGELRRYLHQTSELPDWGEDGNYIPWLFQNALLLPQYLNHEPVPTVGGLPLDSWAAVVAAVENDAAGPGGATAVLDLLAERVTALYLGVVPA